MAAAIPFVRAICLVATVLLFGAGCATQGRYTGGDAAATKERLAVAEAALAEAKRLRSSDVRRAVGFYLTAAQECLPLVIEGGEDSRAGTYYNEACAEITRLVHGLGSGVSGLGLRCPGAGKEYRLVLAEGKKFAELNRYNTLRSSKSSRLKRKSRKSLGQTGVGGALVGTIKPNGSGLRGGISPEGMVVPLASIVTFPGEGEALLQVFLVGREDDVDLLGRQLKLAADFSAPLSTLGPQRRPEKTKWGATLHPEQFEHRKGLHLTEPFSATKIPVVLVHGFFSSPRTWRRSYLALIKDEQIRENYQFWIFEYPSGYGLARNMRSLRRALDETLDQYDPGRTTPVSKQMVMVGHSMGGLLASAMIRSSGDEVWDAMFQSPIDQLDVSAETREELRELTYFTARPEISRVIFIATPHRGSRMTVKPLGRLAGALIEIPANLIRLQPPGLIENLRNGKDIWFAENDTSIETMRPNSWQLELLRSLPMKKGVTYHSIIGDRGKGPGPKCSDGIVDYTSTHIDGAASELLVPSGHLAQKNPKGHAEIIRILREHLRSVGR